MKTDSSARFAVLPSKFSHRLTSLVALLALATAAAASLPSRAHAEVIFQPVRTAPAAVPGTPAQIPAVQVVPDANGNKVVAVAAITQLTPNPSRWQSSMAAFAKSDQERHPAGDGVLFVGSSTIRLWASMSQDFRSTPVIINRGFGGSTMADCDYFVRELVTQYKPKQVMVYAGDNDLAEGRSPAQVRDSFAHFVQKVRAELPAAHISYISIKPSPSRLALMPKIRETNALIADFAQTVPDLRYIDIFNPMLNADGMPRPELFLADKLHLNEAGYQLWQGVIAAHLPAAQQMPSPQVAGATRH